MGGGGSSVGARIRCTSLGFRRREVLEFGGFWAVSLRQSLLFVDYVFQSIHHSSEVRWWVVHDLWSGELQGLEGSCVAVGDLESDLSSWRLLSPCQNGSRSY